MKTLNLVRKYKLSNESIIHYAKSTAGKEGIYISLNDVADKYSVPMGELLAAVKKNETLAQAVFLLAAAGKESKEAVIELKKLPKLLASLVYSYHPAIASTDVKEWIDEIHDIQIKNGRVVKKSATPSFEHLHAAKQAK